MCVFSKGEMLQELPRKRKYFLHVNFHNRVNEKTVWAQYGQIPFIIQSLHSCPALLGLQRYLNDLFSLFCWDTSPLWKNSLNVALYSSSRNSNPSQCIKFMELCREGEQYFRRRKINLSEESPCNPPKFNKPFIVF